MHRPTLAKAFTSNGTVVLSSSSTVLETPASATKHIPPSPQSASVAQLATVLQ